MTLVLVVLTSCLGVSLVRNQGMRNLSLIQQKIQAGESPAAEMIKSVSGAGRYPAGPAGFSPIS